VMSPISILCTSFTLRTRSLVGHGSRGKSINFCAFAEVCALMTHEGSSSFAFFSSQSENDRRWTKSPRPNVTITLRLLGLSVGNSLSYYKCIHRVSEKGAFLFLLELCQISTNFYKFVYKDGKMTEILCYICIYFSPHLTYATALPC